MATEMKINAFDNSSGELYVSVMFKNDKMLSVSEHNYTCMMSDINYCINHGNTA